MLKTPTRRLAPVLAAVVAAGLAGASTASADFSIARCTGDAVAARGASFQTAAFTGFTTAFRSATEPGCGATAPAVTLDPAGSGAGRQALGVRNSVSNPNGDRDASIRLAASDEPLTDTDRTQIAQGTVDANGVNVTTADDNTPHLIPVAIGSVAIMLHLPDGCDYTAATNRPLDGSRPSLDNNTLEAALAGDASANTWGEVIPGVDATCAAKPVVRVVRSDSSGTTFALKQLLARINPTRGWAALPNTSWPNIAANPVARSTATGGGALRTALDTGLVATTVRDNGTTPAPAQAINFANEGGIGYADLATARGGTNQPFTWNDAATDKTFWIALQVGTAADPKAGTTYADPQSAGDGYKTSVSNGALKPRGSSCGAVTPRAIPATTQDLWSQVDATATGQGYPGCTLTYQVAFDDYATVYCNSPEEERKARTVKDWLTLELSTAGQASLTTNDYAPLPAAAYAVALAGSNAVGWKKNGSPGRPCSPQQEQPKPEVTPTPTPVTPGAPNPPAPAPPSNAFTLSSARVSGTTIKLSLQFPGAGKITVATTSAKPKKGKAVKLATKNVAITKAGASSVSLSLDSKAKKALKTNKSLKFTVSITYTPNGGAAKTVTKTVTVKQPKAKTKSKK
ncbi:hypothetical protein OJ997_30980 [Solirubrobacter phytolaccae]|uniref:PBP domain-containing protein n=1 Tax=Solirubrobacter phytolaccae TaxID=1404360 RepID=A0A9X3NNP1_9ACTN|nr:hypothetical protein [Solirubrobacter phytolaccae]MDA0184767.1 hypothetical protein [Solirubrobacter phytolaccae]